MGGASLLVRALFRSTSRFNSEKSYHRILFSLSPEKVVIPCTTMSEELKYIVNELNRNPFNKNYNLISFDSLNSEQLLQVLNDVLAEVDPRNKVDIRGEDPEQTTVRILEMLRVLKFKPGQEMSAAVFCQRLVQGDKHLIHPILEWLLKNMEDLKMRAYLAQYLVKVEVPLEILSDRDVSAFYEEYEKLIEDFKLVHKDSQVLKNSGYSTSELRADIDAMEHEKDIVIKRIERMQQKVENIHNKEAMLEAAHALRLEREREKSLGNQKQEQQASLTHTEQQVQRLQQQLKEMQQAASGATAEGLLQRLEEETNVNTYIVKQKLPKEIGIRNNDLEILRLVLSEPVMSRGDLDALNSKIHSVNSEITQMVEHHLAANNPADDKLAPFRQQAAIIARKKETTAEHLTELRNKLSAAEEELQEKKSQLKEFAGETVLRGEEFKRYVTKLRGRSSLYKRQRTELSALKAEAGVLTRTVEILRARDEAVLRGLAMEEAQHGVSGFRVTEERMEQVSGEKANVDHEKGQTLEEMSSLVLELTQRIATKKAQLAPIIKELRPLRESCQVLTAEYEQKKHVYDTTAAGLESATAKLEQEVQNLKEEIRASESKYHLLEAESVISQVKLDQIAEEMQRYVGNTAGSDKTKSLRDRLTQKINELEKLSRQLKDDQHIVKENQANRSKQMKLWTDLQKLLECKKRCLEEERQNTGTVHREKGAETLVLQ
ncbi:intraflagellar transport protein 81 homolog [Zootermopsis nevadensis]|nr:intraflagellar transport protein 81 homolog [Zootermopsis nevadensis]